MKHDPTFWLIARASGFVAVLLLTSTVVAGLTLKARVLPRVAPAGITDIHRFLSLTAILATGVHLVALVVDTAVDVPILGAFVPGLVGYRTVWTSVGVVVMELMVVIHLSFRLRKVIGRKNWRRLHYMTYLTFGGAVTHGLLAGTDSGKLWALLGYGAAVGLVVSLTAWRVDAVRTKRAATAAKVQTAVGG